VDENPSEAPASEVKLIKLDPTSDLPQVVFSYFWQGAHCCTVTHIATHHVDTGWQTVAAETIDGEGYDFEDISSDSAAELVGIDNSFLYLFESYAGSFAPIKIQRLVGTRLVDVTRRPEYHHRVVQDVYQMEFVARQDQTVWHSNGFLAGWVAAKAMAGEGQQAWQKMLSSYNHDPEFGPEECADPLPIDSCPDAKRRRIDFPIALRQHLIKQGYITDPESYPTPRPSQPSQASDPWQGSTALGVCAKSLDTVRKLILQTFLGRDARSTDPIDAVSVHDDTTLEAIDSSISKLTCAVSYDVRLRLLIGRLAEAGEINRAATLDRLARRSGPTLSQRVRFTVKPTATSGVTYVELLP
jgi:hypothetical protein